MFQVGDKVRKRYSFGSGGKTAHPSTGTIVSINGRWIHVRHDYGDGKYVRGVPSRFDYLADELEHMNPLLRLVDSLGPDDRPLS